MAVVGSAKENNRLRFPSPQKVACGGCHSFFLTEEYDKTEDIHYTKVLGWGGNRHNALGLEREGGTGGKKSKTWRDVVDRPDESVFCNSDPKPRKSDSEFEEELAAFRSFVEVSAGGNHSAILEKKKGEGHMLTESCLWTCGLKAHGRLGQGSDGEDVEGAGSDIFNIGCLPEEVLFSVPHHPGHTVVVQRVCCGLDHTLAVVNILGSNGSVIAHGRVFAWGLGSFGALGTRSKSDEWSPKEVWFPGEHAEGAIRNVVVRQVAAGSKHSIALGFDGKVYSWGHGGAGRLGLGKTTMRMGDSYTAVFEPTLIQSIADTKLNYIAAGEAHSGAIDALGGLYTWGQGSYGRCGHGTPLDISTPSRVEPLLGTEMEQISFGMMHSIGITRRGVLYGWGKGPATGIVGAEQAVIETPREVRIPTSEEVVYQVSAGPMHTLVLMTEGTLYVFGSGSEGRMPNFRGSKIHERHDQPIPEKIEMPGSTLRGYQSGSSGGGARAGTLSIEDDNVPPEQDKWPRQVDCGGGASAVLLNNGELWVWGADVLSSGTDMSQEQEEEAQFKGDFLGRWLPSQMKKGLRSVNIKTIAFGMEHCLALSDERMLYSWGKGEKGQLGTGNLEWVDIPTLVREPRDVISISAGEEHNACISGGGEAYTWGVATGGRLGHSATMTEGFQMLPTQVILHMPEAKDLRLRTVACGLQHTAFISNRDTLLTCGMGWFGRLGHGDTENKYSPAFVTVPEDDLRVAQGYMGSYHSYFVDRDRVLWACGRDQSICRETGNHLLMPERFAPFDREPKRYIVNLATADCHTLAVTCLQGKKGPHELWVWGKNDRGQLGIAAKHASKIDLPWQLKIPNLDKSSNVTLVSTTSWHSLCVVQQNVKDAPPPDVYAWGYSGNGRLGFRWEAVPESGNDRLSPDDQLIKVTRIHPPTQVQQRWLPSKLDRILLGSHRGHEGHSGRVDLSQSSSSWVDVQQKLHAEDPETKHDALVLKSEKVASRYAEYMEDICNLWDKPSPDSTRITEYTIREKERDIEAQYIRTLKVLSLGETDHMPRIENLIRSAPEFVQSIQHYEELVWILQQQPLYLGNLAEHLYNHTADDPEVQLLERVVGRVYSDLEDSRTRNLFKALLRYLIRREAYKALSVETLFNPKKSFVSRLFTQMCMNPYFIANVAKPVLDPESHDSLVHSIIRYTITRDCKWPRDQSTWTSGVLALSEKDYKEIHSKCSEKRGAEGLDTVQSTNISRQRFQDELKDFARLCVGAPGVDVPFDPAVQDEVNMSEEDLKRRFFGVAPLDSVGWRRMRRSGRAGKPTSLEDDEALWRRVMKALHGASWEAEVESHVHLDVPLVMDFVTHFIQDVLGSQKNKDFQMLLVCIFENLIDQRYVIMLRSVSDANDFRPELCLPIGGIVLASVLGGILGALDSGPFVILRQQIHKKALEMEEETFKKAVKKGLVQPEHVHQNEKGEFEKDPSLLMRIDYNIQALSTLFQSEHQADFDGQREFQPAFQKLLTHTCEQLMGVLQERHTQADAAGSAPGGAGKMEVRQREYCNDETEKQLTVDFYTSHYSLTKHRVSMASQDCMLLANILFKYMQTDQHAPDLPLIQLDPSDGGKNDRVWDLVHKILPKAPVNELYPHGAKHTVGWSPGHITVAGNVGEWFNFTMRPRFLEFANTGPEEPTFCEYTEAPIPRSLAPGTSKEGQKSRRGVRCLKPIRHNRGPPMEIEDGKVVYPWEFLMNILQDLSGSAKGDNRTPHIKHRVLGSTFLELRIAFEEIQSFIQQSMDEGEKQADSNLAKMLQSLETGKTIINKMRESHDEKDIKAYIDNEIRKRARYFRHLESLREGANGIQDAQYEYRQYLELMDKKLVQIIKITTDCDLPEEFTGTAQMHAVRLKFPAAKAIKMRERKFNPTPAQKIYDELKRTMGEGKRTKTESLKEMVGVPARTFSLRRLTEAGIITRVHDSISKSVRSNLVFSFHLENEGFQVQIFLNRGHHLMWFRRESVAGNLLREFYIPRKEVMLMSEGWKGAVVAYGNNFVWMNCHRLRRLLAYIVAEGGLCEPTS